MGLFIPSVRRKIRKDNRHKCGFFVSAIWQTTGLFGCVRIQDRLRKEARRFPNRTMNSTRHFFVANIQNHC